MTADILELLETKNFDELTAEERAAVFNEMNKADYKEQRMMILASLILAKKEKAEMVPNPKILIDAQKRLSKKKNGGLGLVIFTHKLPTWLAVAACLLLFFGIRHLTDSENSGLESTVVTEIIHDTIYSEKIVTEQLPGDTVIEYVYVYQPEVIYEMVDNSINYDQKESSFENLYFKEDQYCNIMSCFEPKKGKSVAKDTLLGLIQGEFY